MYLGPMLMTNVTNVMRSVCITTPSEVTRPTRSYSAQRRTRCDHVPPESMSMDPVKTAGQLESANTTYYVHIPGLRRRSGTLQGYISRVKGRAPGRGPPRLEQNLSRV